MSKSLCVVPDIVVDLLALLVRQTRALKSSRTLLVRKGSDGSYSIDREGETVVETWKQTRIEFSQTRWVSSRDGPFFLFFHERKRVEMGLTAGEIRIRRRRSF